MGESIVEILAGCIVLALIAVMFLTVMSRADTWDDDDA